MTVELDARQKFVQMVRREREEIERALYNAMVEAAKDEILVQAIEDAAVTAEERIILQKARSKAVAGLTTAETVTLYTNALAIIDRILAEV